MSCPSCFSAKQAEFSAEMIVHFSGPENLDNPGVWMFPKLLVCLDCGVSRFAIPELRMSLLKSGARKAKSSALEETVHDIPLSRSTPPQQGQ
jgi:hypothetical protein